MARNAKRPSFLAALFLSAALAATLAAGCTSAPASSSASSASDSASAAASSAASTASSESASAGSEAGMINPWQAYNTAKEAAEGAGIDSFDVPNDLTFEDYGTPKTVYFCAMEGIAEADMVIDDMALLIRKGVYEGEPDSDISGDYNEYKHTWTATIDGIEVECSGNAEDLIQKAVWKSGSYDFAVGARFAGNSYDVDRGITEADLAPIVTAIS